MKIVGDKVVGHLLVYLFVQK